MNEAIQTKIKDYLMSHGACDVGFCVCDNAPDPALPYAVSFAVRLSDAVIDEIDGAPTHSYFHHYRTVNFRIDQLALDIGSILEDAGFRYLPVAASQSINGFSGRYSHKAAARLAGLGSIGKNNLFLHRIYGPRVRLGTVFTSCIFPTGSPAPDLCVGCDACVRACPANAIKGTVWTSECVTSDLFDPEKCSTHMKKAYQLIGRGAVCGICMRVCPAVTKKEGANGTA